MPDLPGARTGDQSLPASSPEGSKSESGIQAPSCSVIVPIFNNCFYTRLCLDALRHSRSAESEYELIVIDNGSTDDTPSVLAVFANDIQTVIRNDANLGFARASNQGAALARGEFLVFLNNDVVVQPGWLKALLSAAQSDLRIGAVGGRLLYPDGTIQHAGIVFAPGPSPHHAFAGQPHDFPGALMRRDYQAVTGACMLVGRQLFQAVGGFDEGYQNAYEDIDFCFKVRQIGRRVVYCPESLAHHFESSTVGRFLRNDHSSTRFQERWGDKVIIDFEPPERMPPDVRGAGSLVHLELEALSDRVRTLTAQNSQVLGLLADSTAAEGRDSGIKEKLISLLRPIDILYYPDQLSPATAGTVVRVSVVITNLGRKTLESGSLRLSYHWRRIGGTTYDVWDGRRTVVEEQVEPGRPVSVAATVLLPDSPGYYLLEWDAIQEGVAWLSQRGVTPYRQFIAVRSAPSIVASIQELPVMLVCRCGVDVQVLLKGDLENLRPLELTFGWRWITFDGQENSPWELGTSPTQVEAGSAVLGLSVKAPSRSGCFLLEVGRRGPEGVWMPLETIGGASYVLASNGVERESGREPEPADWRAVRREAEKKWLPGEAEYCLARIERLLLSTGSRLEAAKLQSILADDDRWPGASRVGELEWAIRRWLAEFAEVERLLYQQRKRADRLANIVDTYRKNRLKNLLSLLDRLPFRRTQHRAG